jgi:pSer/pThr/pTyr-binding forkhead associated (FHA) protein
MPNLPWRQRGRARVKAGMARLEPLPGTLPGVIPLHPDTPLVVGRAADCGLAHENPALSRHHARIFHAGGVWRVEDLGSANGTTVGDVRVSSQVLTNGADIVFGGALHYRFVLTARGAVPGNSVWNQLCCLQLAPVAPGRPFMLRRRLTVVGRDPTADLRLDHAQVSGIHARILRHGSRVVLRDTGSRNGTTINDVAVSEAALAPGDRVSFGDIAFVVRRSFMPTGPAIAVLATGVLLAAVAAVVVGLFFLPGRGVKPLWDRQMYLEQVTTSLVSAVRAQDRIPPARDVALAQINIAQRSLIAADLLRPDRQTPAEVLAAMTEAARSPEVVRVLHGRDIGRILAAIETEPEAALPPPPLPSDAYNLTTELSHLVAEFGIDTRDTPIPAELVREVERFTRFWSQDQRDFTMRARERGLPLLADMRRELRQRRLPEILCYLPFIESGYQTTVVSKAGARGLWQFMPGTARDYGLRVDDEVDERTDPIRSTQAACLHLEMLLKIFGPDSFMCAIAAYNKGHNGMRRCLERSGELRSTWRFWNPATANDGCLKPETLEYVPRFLAAVVVFRNPEFFGLDNEGG